jgi:bifunctional non-homologous end joining protein LigD
MRCRQGDEWLCEAKFDGYRVLALKDGSTVKLLSHKGNDLTADYPAIRSAISALKAKAVVVTARWSPSTKQDGRR